ncbi:MAG: RluA family pseudouridine synthase [Acutalibacteraceae bacterium]
MRTIETVIPKEYDGRKLYSFIKGKMGMSSKLIRTLKTYDDGLLVNGVHTRTVDLVHEGDLLTVNIRSDEKMSLPGTQLPEVVYEDDDLLIVNKPAMLPIHESHNHQGDTLANSVALYLSKKGLCCSFRAIGRLDKGTSGLVVCALNSHAASKLNGKIKKEYLAVATGKYSGQGTIDAPIYRPDPMKTCRCVDERGDRAVTHWTAVSSNDHYTLLRINLETGRTHQIRVHFAHLGTPLAGDRMYGKEEDEIGHQALHCARLSLIHPVTEKEISCEAPMPQEMKRFLEKEGLC